MHLRADFVNHSCTKGKFIQVNKCLKHCNKWENIYVYIYIYIYIRFVFLNIWFHLFVTVFPTHDKALLGTTYIYWDTWTWLCVKWLGPSSEKAPSNMHKMCRFWSPCACVIYQLDICRVERKSAIEHLAPDFDHPAHAQSISRTFALLSHSLKYPMSLLAVSDDPEQICRLV